jgi:basic membrane protein A
MCLISLTLGRSITIGTIFQNWKNQMIRRVAFWFVALTFVLGAPNSKAEDLSSFRVAYLPCARVNDQSWSQAGYEGLLAAQKKLDLQISYTESLTAATVENAARDYAARGFNLVMMYCAPFMNAGLKVAKDFPKTWFMVVTASSTPDNVISVNLAQQQGDFVAGVMAGLTTKTNRVGVIVSYNTLGYNRQVEGFRLGARFANPKVTSYVTYMNSAEDAGKAKEAALAQYDAGADIILAAADQAATGVYQAGQESNKYVVTEYADQNAVAPAVILGSVLFNTTNIMAKLVEDVATGNAKAGIVYPGLKDGVGNMVENAPLIANIPAEARECMKTVRQQILDGQIVVPGDDVLGKQNSSQSVDTKSLVVGGASTCLNKRS